MKRIFVFFTLLSISLSVNAGDEKYDCSFIVQALKEINNDPKLRANVNFNKNDIYFLLAGVGIGSSLNGIDKEEFTCVYNKYETKVIWGGGDFIACEGQHELGKKIMKYVGEYNISLRRLLVKSGEYKCGI